MLRTVKVTVEFTMKTDQNDQDALREELNTYLSELIESDSLDYDVKGEDDEDEDF